MGIELGILLAFGALICWGFGDFFIQRSTRKFGSWETLFIISSFATIVLFPFIYRDLAILSKKEILVLLIASSCILFAALFNFEGLKRGKLAIIEPIFVIEVPISILLAFFIINEVIDSTGLILIAILVIGLILVSLKDHFTKRRWLEKGVILAIIGSIFMGSANFFFGLGSRITNPLIINWFVSIFLAVICFVYLVLNKKIKKLVLDVKKNKRLVLSLNIFDNGAWIFYAFAALFAPIGIVVAISESYIVLAVLLGLIINKERLMKHQKFGLIISIISAIALALKYS